MIKKVKKHLKKWRKIVLSVIHNSFFRIKKLPWPIKYSSDVVCIAIGFVCLPNPLLPGWLFLGIGLWIFSPAAYYKYIWKHVRTQNFEDVIWYHSKSVFGVLKVKYKFYFKLKFYKKLLLKRAKRQFKKTKIKIIR